MAANSFLIRCCSSTRSPEESVKGHSYLYMPQNWLIPQLEEDYQDFIFQKDEAPPHFLNEVKRYLIKHLPQYVLLVELVVMIKHCRNGLRGLCT
ncbi:hypothetical protein TNCV_412451 [Trichonephila clavipes]|uniref:Uncharacterized protein n=1 Tax=Trichonephila clavipes TaxID=2585209 RepID=A0A8X6S899_TRICX|nr:hypothetical protein TNCV_412451 [Trichonephila clavipes]